MISVYMNVRMNVFVCQDAIIFLDLFVPNSVVVKAIWYAVSSQRKVCHAYISCLLYAQESSCMHMILCL
jgi:hypothetical protein